MAFKDEALALLRGGLPAVLDYGSTAKPSGQGDVAVNAPKGRVEQTPPEPTKKDIEPFLQRTVQVTENFEINLAALVVAGVAVGIIAIRLAFR